MGLSWSGTVGRASVGGNQDSLLNGSSAAADLGGLTAILNSSALKASLQALSSNTDSVSVQYPRQVTVSNRSVTMSALEKVPVKDTTTTTDTNSDSQTQTEVNYIDVGTNITILPRIIDDNKIKMNINIKVSSIARYETIDNNDYPVVAEREYKTEAIVDDGYTLAIGGLRGSSLTDKTSEVPVISKLPLLGELFKHRSRSHSDTNLLIFISPQVLKENRGGMKEDPNFIVAKDQDYPERRTFKGTKDEEYTDVLLSLDGMDHEIDVQSQRVYEGLGIDGVEKTLRSLQNELALMKVRVREIALKNPNKDVSQATQKIEKYTADINELRKNINKRKAIFDR
jgi:type II secretory pathway component GspD/PulD (secretin)